MPEEWFCLKVYSFFVGFLILEISYKSHSPLSFAIGFCVNEALPPFVFSLLSRNTLGSPAKTVQFSFEVFHELAKFT